MTISSITGLAAYQTGSYGGAVPGTTTTTTLNGAASLLQGISGASGGVFGALSGTASTSASGIFSALGATGTMQSAIQAASKSVNPNLGGSLDIKA